MPIWTYQCEECQHEEDRLVRNMEDKDKQKCRQKDCDGDMKREEIAITTNAGYNWSAWQR